MTELSEFQREIFLVAFGALASAILAATGFALKWFFRGTDPVDAFLARHERALLASPGSSAVVRPETTPQRVTQALAVLETARSSRLDSGSEPSPDEEFLTQAEMNRDAAEHFAQATEILEGKIAEAFGLLDSERCNALRESQTAWCRYRDLFAGAVADFMAGGSMWPLLYDSERVFITDKRVEEIELLIRQEQLG